MGYTHQPRPWPKQVPTCHPDRAYVAKGLCRQCWQRNRDLWRFYNITVDDYERLYEAQHGVCKICGRAEETKRFKWLSVDHNHRTQTVRGLLCAHCNRGIGAFREEVRLLQKAIEYLSRTE